MRTKDELAEWAESEDGRRALEEIFGKAAAAAEAFGRSLKLDPDTMRAPMDI